MPYESAWNTLPLNSVGMFGIPISNAEDSKAYHFAILLTDSMSATMLHSSCRLNGCLKRTSLELSSEQPHASRVLLQHCSSSWHMGHHNTAPADWEWAPQLPTCSGRCKPYFVTHLDMLVSAPTLQPKFVVDHMHIKQVALHGSSTVGPLLVALDSRAH